MQINHKSKNIGKKNYATKKDSHKREDVKIASKNFFGTVHNEMWFITKKC